MDTNVETVNWEEVIKMLEQLYASLSSNVESDLLKFAIWVGTLVATAIVGVLVSKLLVHFMEKMLRRSKLNPTAIPFIAAVTKIFLYVLVGISIATSLNLVEPSSIVTALGAVGLAVSLAVKDSLSNLMGGMLLIISRTFQLGDYVELDGMGGTVIEIGMIHTILKTPDNKRIMIPNGQVTNARIVNYSAENTRRVDFFVTIDRHSDLEEAKAVLLAVAQGHALALKDPAPAVRAEGITELGVRLSCKVWVNSGDYWTLFYDLVETAKARLDEAGIVLPVRAIGDTQPG